MNRETRKLGSYLKEENLPLLKEYVKTCLYSDLSMMTDTASLDAAQEYQTAAGGIEKKKDFERTVSETVQEKLGFQCGRVFCETYFNEDAKQDVRLVGVSCIFFAIKSKIYKLLPVLNQF